MQEALPIKLVVEGHHIEVAKKKEKANACGSVEWTVEGRGKDQVTHRASASGRSIIQSRPITINRMEGRKPEPEEKFVLVHPFWIC